MTTNLRKSVEQAAQSALQVYLQNELDPQFGGGKERCVVADKWPEPDSPLPFRAISILPAGKRDDTHIQEQDIRRVDLPGQGEAKLYTWRVAACRQPIQLDVWSCYASHRDDLLARLEDALRKGERYTLGVWNGNPVRDGVLLALDPNMGGFQGFADFTFDGPRKIDSDRPSRVREFRATIDGLIDVDLTVQAASARLARVLIKVALDPSESASNPPADITFTMNTTTGDVAVTGS